MTPALRDLSDGERCNWLRLIRSENIGPRTFATLIARYGDAGAALDALPALIARGRAGARGVTIFPADAAARELDAARRLGVSFLALCEPAYPAPLRAIDAPPPLIAVKGSLEALRRPMVAIVGSRNASGSGLIFADRLAKGLGDAGYVVVSGLARGIDGRAHQASLASGTVAVLAGGHDRVYPSEHEALTRRIVENGALVSEMPLGWEPRARDFPRRNRLVSGLSLGVIVVEASRRSGSLITARFANEQGREVFAVPGSPLDARADGTNDLLRQGATLCASVEDVLGALAPVLGPAREGMTMAEPRSDAPEPEPLWEEIDLFAEGDELGPALPLRETLSSPVSQPAPPRISDGVADIDRVLELIGPTPVLIDDLIRASALPARHLQAALMELEIRHQVRRLDGNRVALNLERAAAGASSGGSLGGDLPPTDALRLHLRHGE
ncbi:MAG TPA: DNA-processing protein DprA [Lichenihabitans sp.]|jgi:DNA processing protein|nr:DNA-processing protein DprA [Lichenihabitans sp.]